MSARVTDFHPSQGSAFQICSISYFAGFRGTHFHDSSTVAHGLAQLTRRHRSRREEVRKSRPFPTGQSWPSSSTKRMNESTVVSKKFRMSCASIRELSSQMMYWQPCPCHKYRNEACLRRTLRRYSRAIPDSERLLSRWVRPSR